MQKTSSLPCRERTALLLVDLQHDFMPGGALPVPEGRQVLAPVRRLMGSGRFGVLVATQDWHPRGHVSFASSDPGREPLETIELHGHEQTLWPDHCLQGSHGAKLHPDLPWAGVSAVIRKGMEQDSDSYSGFRNNWDRAGTRPSTGLAGYLRDRAVTDVVVCGLAREICAKWTAEDAAEAGFHVWFVWDATRPVDAATNDRVAKELSRRGIRVVSTPELLRWPGDPSEHAGAAVHTSWA